MRHTLIETCPCEQCEADRFHRRVVKAFVVVLVLWSIGWGVWGFR